MALAAQQLIILGIGMVIITLILIALLIWLYMNREGK